MRKFVAGFIFGAVVMLAASGWAQDSAVKLMVNGKEVVSDVPPTIINGRTLVPARPLAEALGATVKWDGETRTVIVIKVDGLMLKVNGVDTRRPVWVDENGQPLIEAGTFLRTVLPAARPDYKPGLVVATGVLQEEGGTEIQLVSVVKDNKYVIGMASAKEAGVINYTWDVETGNLQVSAP